MNAPFHSLKSVRRKLVAGVLLTSVVALLLTGGSLFLFDLHSYRQVSSTDLGIQAELLGNATSAALQFDDRAVAGQNLDFLKARPTVRLAAIYDASGRLFAQYARENVAPGGVPERASPPGLTLTGDRIEVFHPVRAGDEVLGTIYLQADLEMGKRIVSYAAIALAVTLAALMVALLLSARLQSGITRPITEISTLAREVVATRDYSVRARRSTDDELGTLADAFNEMLSQIEQRTAALEATRDEIAQLNKDLERRVSERTAELEESNLRLIAADSAKSRFLSMMSHEIRTPMNGVLGLLELLTLTRLDAQQHATLGVVRESGRSLLRIIDDILDFSKIEAGKLEVHPEIASVAKIVEGVVGIYSGNASSKALTLKSQVDPRISPAVMVDPLRLQQILNNLVSNAIKFTSHGYVEVRAELVGRSDEVDTVRFTVSDSGIGISTEGQARLFEPFAQAGAHVARNFGGTGLGLSIGQRLASLMGGTITMQSEPGKGTTVSLVLPLPIGSPEALPEVAQADKLETVLLARREAPPVEEAEREGTLVLLVDDHPMNRLVLMRQVATLGYAAESANDGREALEKWRSGRFKLVVTDCNMPEMDGFELTHAIRDLESARERRTTIIACTANALRGEAEKCLEAGMDDYLSKPVAITDLMATLDRWLPLPRRGPPLDLAALDENIGGVPDLRNQALAQFQETNGVDAAQLADAIRARDLGQAKHLAHRIKGASRILGAAALAQVCQEMESAAAKEDWGTILANYDAFWREVARLDAFVAQELAKPNA